MAQIGKTLVLLGVVLVVVGLILSLGPRIPWLGQLPGDIVIRRERFSFYFPITTSILLSLILTLILNLWRK
jgi:formate hydrogenlyase subunit 3/multisubunit Na+/H+ antiporter MnhD subunit